MERIKGGRKLVYNCCLSAFIHTLWRSVRHTHTYKKRVKLWSCSWPSSLFELARLTEAHLLIGWCAIPEGPVRPPPSQITPPALTHDCTQNTKSHTRMHTHSQSSSLPPSLPPLPPTLHPSPKLLLRKKTGASQRGDSRQAGRTEWPREESITHRAHTHKTHTVRAGVVDSHR